MIRRWLESDMGSNLLWLAVSLLLASGVWYIAVTSADPIEQRRFYNRPIQFVPSRTAVMTDAAARSANVTIQGSQTTVSSRRAEDIVVRADLSRLGPGTHNVPLVASVARPETNGFRRLVTHTQPSQVTVELESTAAQAKKILVEVSASPPIGFRHDEPIPDIDQVIVSGAASRVSQVVAVRGELDLSASRNPIALDLRLYAVDADGQRVDAVELAPATATVNVKITRRDDIKQIAVRPNILIGTQPQGYTFYDFSYDPSSLFISGAPDQLEQIADTLFTEPISLEGHREGFVTTLPVRLPNEELFVMGGDNNITVSIEIVPIIDSRQIDDINVEHIGLGADYTVSIVPTTVSAIVTGPVVQVDALAAADIQVILDLEGLDPGVYDTAPTIYITGADLSEDNVSLSPSELNVEIALAEAEAEAQATEVDASADADAG